MQKKKIDLHGVRHADVHSYLDQKIQELWWEFDPDIELEIITGHSSKMKELVKKSLADLGMECNEGGYLGTKPTSITTHMGDVPTEIEGVEIRRKK